MSGLLGEIRRVNGLGGLALAEPYAGGAGAALTLLYLEETSRIHINDADPAMFDFWWTLVNRPKPFLGLLERTPVSVEEWQRQRGIYRSAKPSRLRRGFAAFYLNRCNRSGIITNGGPIGGITQRGRWKLDARFNRIELYRRCAKVAEYGDRIAVTAEDGIDFISCLDTERTFFFIDPPYYEKGPTLYMNSLDPQYHEKLAEKLRTMSGSAWVLTYDDCPEIRDLYQNWATVRPFGLRYVASERRAGKEVMITPKWMELPDWQKSAAVNW